MAEEKKAPKKAKKVAEPVVEESAAVAKEKKAPRKVASKKAAKVAKEKVKPVAPEKLMPTEAKAIARNVKVTPRKVRLVIDLVRGLEVKQALSILGNVNRSASKPVIKVIKSAVAYAVNNLGMDEDTLYIDEIYANDGLKMKRYMPRAKGSASGLVKRSSNITVVVKMK